MLRLLVLSITSLALFASCASSHESSSSEQKANLYYKQGTADLVRKDYTMALKNLLEAYRLNPEDSNTLNNLGMAFYFKRDKKHAIQYIKEALTLNPKNSDARMNLATIYMNDQMYNLAEEQYNIILDDLVFEGQFKTYYNLALLALKKNDERKAITYLKQSVNTYENYCPAHYKLGEIAFAHKEYKEALDHFHNAGLGTCFNLAEPFLKKADTLSKMHKFAEAKAQLEDVVKRFLTTKYEIIAREKLRQLNESSGNQAEVEPHLLRDRELSSPSF